MEVQDSSVDKAWNEALKRIGKANPDAVPLLKQLIRIKKLALSGDPNGEY